VVTECWYCGKIAEDNEEIYPDVFECEKCYFELCCDVEEK